MHTHGPTTDDQPSRHAASVVALPPTAEVLGVPLALTDYDGTMDWMDATIAAGGRGYVWEREGFTFDTGPSVLTMPDLIADVLRAAGSDLSALGPLKRLDPAYRAVYADGSTIMVRGDRDAMRQEIAETCGSVDAAASFTCRNP